MVLHQDSRLEKKTPIKSGRVLFGQDPSGLMEEAFWGKDEE
jgi:hypothetical protein